MILPLQWSPAQPHEQRQMYLLLPVGTHVPPFKQDAVEQAFVNATTHMHTNTQSTAVPIQDALSTITDYFLDYSKSRCHTDRSREQLDCIFMCLSITSATKQNPHSYYYRTKEQSWLSVQETEWRPANLGSTTTGTPVSHWCQQEGHLAKIAPVCQYKSRPSL